MRIINYLAIIALACFLSAHMLERRLSHEFNHVQQLSSDYNSSLLWQKDLERIENSTSQFLVSTDLVIASGNTYLVNGAKNIGQYLLSELTHLKSNNKFKQFNQYNHQIINSLANITKILNILDKVSDIPASKLASGLRDILTDYDVISLSLTNDIHYLLTETSEHIKRKSGRVKQEKALMITLGWIIRAAFFTFILLMLWVANRKICKPINDLIQSSRQALEGQPFKATTHAPLEIIKLSSDFKILTETLSYQASHDPLTELPNRRAFEQHLHKMIDDDTHHYFLCFIDLDYFKTINDTCGHDAGDEILKNVAKILMNNVREYDRVARLGGDEFALIIKDCTAEKTQQIAKNISTEISNLTYHWADETFSLTASIGIAPYVKGYSTTELLNAADIACGAAKDSGRNSVHVFNSNDESSNEKRQDMLSVHQINTALNNDLFVLYKQDIVPLQQQNEGKSFEILLRMKDSNNNIVSPAAFLPVAERYQLSSKIDRWVVNAVCDYYFKHRASLDAIKSIAINLSSHSLIDNALERFIIKKLTFNELPAEKICFEITETAAITNIKRAQLFMKNISALGCKFALDDFGSGHSSYAYIKELPTDKIKIDGSFVSTMTENPMDFATVKSICDISKTVNQEVIAEFVETKEIVDALVKLGVDYGQGYYFAKPEPLENPSP